MHIGEKFYSDQDLKNFGFKSIGNNVKIKKNVGIFFTENVSIGNNVRIDDFTIIVASGSDVIIGNNVHIAANCYIAGSDGFEMKDFSGLAPGVMIFSGSDDYSGKKLTNPTIPKKYTGGICGKVTLEKHVIIGAGTVILPKIIIGEGSSVGAMSLVTKSLPPWGIYFGTPAKKLRERSKELLNLEAEILDGERYNRA
jgi:acetyltransferase-like isoleucine patch superfamily enzyme